MTARELFEALAPLIAPELELEYGRRDLCIAATALAVDVAAYFGIAAKPLPVRAYIYNRAFAARLQTGEEPDVKRWQREDGSYSVGVGMLGVVGGGSASAARRAGKWAGHLIATAEGVYGDFSIGQAERLEHGIVTGPALIGPLNGNGAPAFARNDEGTTVEYVRIENNEYRSAPDWKLRARRRRLAGRLIRLVR